MTRDTVILVRDPRTREDGGKFTDYQIYIRTTNIQFNKEESLVRRRFREFVWIRKQLLTAGIKGMPELPPKKLFDRFEEDFVEFRRQGLQRFLKELLDVPGVLSAASVHMFLQTNHTIPEIADMLDPASASSVPAGPDYTLSPEVFIVKDPLSRQTSKRSSPLAFGHNGSVGADSGGSTGHSGYSCSSLPSTVGPSPIGPSPVGSLREASDTPGPDSRSGTPGRKYSPPSSSALASTRT